MFVESDVALLNGLLQNYTSIVTTSYVLAEASNLANKLTGKLKSDWYAALAKYAVLNPEAHVPTDVVGRLQEVGRFGITDAALRHLAETHTVITLEYPLWGYLNHLGLNVINFNHLRSTIPMGNSL